MPTTKADRIDEFIRKRVREAVNQMIADYPDRAGSLRDIRSQIEVYAAWNVARDRYRLRELLDICAWKKPPKAD